MSVKSLRIVNILLWGGAVVLLVGIVVGYLGSTSSLRAFFNLSAGSAPVTVVIVTPTPAAAVPLLPFDASAAATVEPETAVTYVAYSPPVDAGAVVTYTLPEIGVIPVRIRIPDIDLDAPIVPIGWKEVTIGGVTQPMWDVPNLRAAGWHETSAKIAAGGNTVLNGHNTSNGEVFRYLYKLEVGAEVLIEAEDGVTYPYTVTEKLILSEAGQSIDTRIQHAQYILPTADERLTLVTCHPYGSVANRLLIIAHPAAPTKGD
ncbi:MAG TPA: sortase [Anaerolineae bacterium]|nr:sortase [Anaerolineae bacterium]HQH37691.1 sortase [Anaerolineae bacterium]